MAYIFWKETDMYVCMLAVKLLVGVPLADVYVILLNAIPICHHV